MPRIVMTRLFCTQTRVRLCVIGSLTIICDGGVGVGVIVGNGVTVGVGVGEICVVVGVGVAVGV